MDEQAPTPKPSFWKRQFNDTPTRAQKIFDILFGAILPPVLLLFDPIVFKGYGCTGTGVENSVLVYFAVVLGIISLLVWHFAPMHVGGWSAPFAGAFLAGGLFAGVIAVAMLPLSVFGLIMIIGVLGFLPFFVSFVYFRNAVRALRTARLASPGKAQLAGLMIAGALVVVGIPFLIQNRAAVSINQSVDKIRHRQNEGDVATAINELRTTNMVCLSLCRGLIIDQVLSLPFELMDYEEKISLVEQATGAPPDGLCVSNTQYSE